MQSDWLSAILVALACLAVVVHADRVQAGTGDVLAPELEWWDQWRAETKEPIPAFNALKSWADPPPLLRLQDGRPVQSREDWEARKAEIRRLLCHYIIGSFPDHLPPLADAEVVTEEKLPHARRRIVRLTYRTATPTAETVPI